MVYNVRQYLDIFVVVDPCFLFLKPYKTTVAAQDAVATNAPDIKIRTAQAQDLSQLADILADSFHPPTGMMRWAQPILRLGIYEDLRHRVRSHSDHYLCLVAVSQVSSLTNTDEEIAGTVEIAVRSSPSWQPQVSKCVYISNLAVSQSCRRQGVAKQLLLACDCTAKEWGFHQLSLHVLENNYQARQLYLKTGYQLCKVEPSYGMWKLLRRPKRLLLQKNLATT
ncbi:MAG: GNAT family N-acetyltransferase [Symploca sp. SIO2E6]|nr:GNAT family N-acetyltransferase [Symploca sp. SIO2E6]